MSFYSVGNLRGDPAFTLGFDGYLREKEVDPQTIDFVTTASCAGHSSVITREIPEGESEDIKILTETSYANMAPSVMALTSTMTRAY